MTKDLLKLSIDRKVIKVIKHSLLRYWLVAGVVQASSSFGHEMLEKIIPVYETTGKQHDPRTLEGKVTNALGIPMAGVNVVIKGTTTGTSTDAEGKFSIKADNENVLVFSFIGYKTFETSVHAQVMIDIVLEEDITSLREVEVNAGYWNVREREKTGNISKVKSEEIQKQPVTNPLGALIGRLPGVFIQQTSGAPGGEFIVRIRGVNSIRREANHPLYLVDGVPFTSTSLTAGTVSQTTFATGVSSPLNSINPSDIESIEILKDADATAIYGSRGSNGVVLITTKKGKQGKTKVDLDFNHGVGQVNNYVELLNTKQYLEMRREAFKNDNMLDDLNDPANDMEFADIKLWFPGRYTDWQKELLGGNSHMTNAKISLSGGNANTQFLVSGSYYKEGTVFPGNFKYQRGASYVNMNHTSDNKRLSASFSMSMTIDENGLPKNDLTRTALYLPPNAPALYDENGELNWENGTFDNPIAKFTRPIYKGNTKNFIANTTIGYTLTDALKVKSSLGYTNISLKELSTNPISSSNPGEGRTTASGSFGNKEVSTWIIEPQLEYFKDIQKGKLSALIGTTFQQNLKEGQSLNAQGFTNDELIENPAFATSVRISGTDYSKYRYTAVFARVNYTWDGKYILNLTGRRDGSSRFGPNKRLGNFGAAGIAWIFSNEKFLKEQSILSFGKLRASYGTTGSDQIGDYQYLDSYSASPYPYNGVSGLIPTQLSNPDYAWEINKKVEVALEFGFLQDRLMLSASWYRNRSSNQLIGYSLPVMTGFPSIQYNLPATVQNTGLEIELSADIFRDRNLIWQTAFNVTIPQNQLVAFPDLDEYPSYANLYEIGKPLSIRRVFHFTGVDPQTGLYAHEDANENGEIDFPGDYSVIKEMGQKFYGGLNSSIQFKGFQLDVFFQFVKQAGDNYLVNTFLHPPGNYGNQPFEVMNRWQEPGDVSFIQRFTAGGDADAFDAYRDFRSSDNASSDASFIRLKNVSLSWSIPDMWSNKYLAQQTRIYVRCQNLLTITKYKGLDPETQSGSTLPPLMIVTAGLSISF